MGARTIVVAILSVMLCSCANKEDADNLLSVTIEPYRYIVESIAGDDWQVRTIVPKGSNPEVFDPTPRDIISLTGSKAYFMVGRLGFENMWKERVASLHPDMRIVDTSQGISYCSGDPHVWTSPDNIHIIAQNVCNTLCSIDTASAGDYRRRLALFGDMINRTDSIIRDRLSKGKERGFLIFHPSLTYFARRYGLQQIAIEHEGKEPSVSHMCHVIDEAVASGIEKVLIQAEFDCKNAQSVAHEIDAQVHIIDPLSYDIPAQMLHICNVLSKNSEQ